jgi:hypothetical protein
MDDVTPRGEAHLALELEAGVGTRGGGERQVGIIEHDQRAVAAELEADLLEPLSGQCADTAADLR